MFEMRYFDAHQIVEFSRLKDFLELIRQLKHFWIFLVHSHVIQQIVEHISNHLDLLLGLQIIVNLPTLLSLILLVSSLIFKSLKVSHNISNAFAKLIELLSHHVGHTWIVTHLLLVLVTTWILRVIDWELRIGGGWLGPVLGLRLLLVLIRIRMSAS